MKTPSRQSVSRFVSAATLLALFAVGAFPNAAAQVASEPGSKLAARLETALRRMKETAYQHTTEINEETGSLKCDCSGFLGHALRKVFPEAYLSVRGIEAQWRGRPLAVTFYETFSAAAAGKGNGRWRHVAKLREVKPGDILAWRKEVLEKGRTTGHVAMVAGEPVVEKDGRVRLRVIDSTDRPHSNDTRAEKTSGVGAGDMYFIVDREGRPTGFHVRDGALLNKQAFAFGRLVDLGDAASPVFDVPADANFIGLGLIAAEALASERKLESMVIDQDGQVIAVPSRPSAQRIHFVLRAGKIIRVLRGETGAGSMKTKSLPLLN